MTVTEPIVETQDDSQKTDIRRLLDLLIEEMDTLQMFGLSRSFIKKQVAKYRKLLSNPVRCTGKGTKKEKWFPTVGEMHTNFHSGHMIDEMVHFFKRPDDHHYKKEYALLLCNKLTYIDDYLPPGPPRHEDYGEFPVTHHKWVDAAGNDRWTSKNRVAETWRKKHPEVKKWHSRGKE